MAATMSITVLGSDLIQSSDAGGSSVKDSVTARAAI